MSNDRGIFVSAPYHKARQGQFYRVKATDKPGLQALVPESMYTASSRAKLSLHPPNKSNPDSFLVHFSGAGILSGFDEEGQPKGLALKGPPMPEITTGPTFGLLVWGLEDFDNVRRSDKHTLVFQQGEMYPNQCTAEFNAYHLEFFLLPNTLRKAKKKISTFYKRYTFEGVTHGFVLRVVELPNMDLFFGIACIRRKVGFSGSGYSLSSPRLSNWMISGTYPPQFPVDGHSSLDFPANPDQLATS
jgi:hypothetical protein